MLTEQQILHYVSRQPKHMAGFKQLIHDMGLKGKDRRTLQQLLRDLTRQRKLIAIGKERWGLPTSASNQDLVVGRLRMHRDGYGFVIPEPGSLPARAQGKLQGDIFIPPPEVGIFHYGSGGRNFVTPIDEKLAMEIIIPPGMEYPKAEDEEGGPSEDDRDLRTHDPRVAQPPSAVASYKSSGPQAPSPAHDKAPTPKHPSRQSPHR